VRSRAGQIFVALCLLLVPAGARAQTFDVQRITREIAKLPDVVVTRLTDIIRKAEGKGIELVRTRYELVPDVELSDPPPGLDGARVGTDAFSSRVIIPVPLQRDLALIGALSYETLTFRHEGFAGNFPADRVQEVRTRGALLYDVTERWRFTGGLEIGMLSDSSGIAGDAEHVSLDDFQAGVLVIFDHQLTPQTSLGIGAGYSTTFGLPLPIPAARATVEVGDFRFSTTLPSSIAVGWAPHRRVELGARAALSGGTYHLRRSDQDLSTTMVYVGPYAEIETLRGLHVDLATGLMPWRRLRLDDDAGDEVLNLDPAPTWFLRAELSFRL
jgi:hypothetical protein